MGNEFDFKVDNKIFSRVKRGKLTWLRRKVAWNSLEFLRYYDFFIFQRLNDKLSTLLPKRARTEKKIVLEAPAYSGLIAAFDYLENCNRRIFNHGWVNFPLAYTQASQFLYSYFDSILHFCWFLISKPELMK